MEKCLFACGLSDKPLVNAGPGRIQTVINASKLRGDGLSVDLQRRLNEDNNLVLKCHNNCVSTYTSSSHIKRYLKRQEPSHTRSVSEPPPVKRTRRSEMRSFRFLENCIFCGDICEMSPDPRNPSRWRRSVLCMTADRGTGRATFKEAILNVCALRNDEWGNEVDLRLQGAISDLPAADARYHEGCRVKFMAPRSVQSASNETTEDTDIAFDTVVGLMLEDQSHVWTSVELHAMYRTHDGVNMSRGKLTHCLSEHFSGRLVVLSSPGLANIIMFRERASTLLRLVEDDEDDKMVATVANRIVKESKDLTPDRHQYKTRIDTHIASGQASSTLMSILSHISAKLDASLPAVLIGNMITSIITNRPTSLQVALGILVREKCLIECFRDFSVTCSYDEVLRFKTSAAKAAASDVSMTSRPISDSNIGLIQAVADNYDANISSQNGLKSTHALALLLTQQQPMDRDEEHCDTTIRRINKTEMQTEVTSDVAVMHYSGPKKPHMPDSAIEHAVLPLRVLAQQSVSLRKAQLSDFEFLQHVVTDPLPSEYGGFNTKMTREEGQSPKPATMAMYTPLIDMTPSDPDTMMTAMSEAQRLTKRCGQTYTVFTADQQLYRVMINVMWVHPDRFHNFVPRLGGMHMLMSFVGCVGTLMANSGLEDILKSAFGGVNRMLTGKNFPQNIRAIRMVVEEVLHSTLQGIGSHTDLITELDTRAAQSRTTKHWVNCVIKPVLIMMLFVRAEREGDWPLHLLAVNAMMPYFFAAGHINYARYGLYYLRSMECLPIEVLNKFMKGEHVMRHKPGLWNAIWSDMFIETTFMRYGHGPGGLVGITLNQSALKRWALSLHTCSRLIKDVAEMREGTESPSVMMHKEEMKGRKESDGTDRKKIRNMLETCADPLKPTDHPSGVMNIVSGQIGTDKVNVDDAVEIGMQQMTAYESSLPEGFGSPLTNKVVTMSASKKAVKCGSGQIFDTQLIYSRLMGIITTRDIDLKSVFHHELAPIPTSMFEDNGDMRITKSKSVLKNKLQVEHSARTIVAPDTIIVDGSAILWCIHWPSNGTVQDFVDGFWTYTLHKLRKADVFLVFDRYYDYSIKSYTRTSRKIKKAHTGHKLRTTTPLPSQQTILTTTENKVQLIDILCEQIQEKAKDLPRDDDAFNHRLLITGSGTSPTEVRMGVVITRTDMRTTHEEADVIIAQQMVCAATESSSCITIVSDDTDVFVLLLHFYQLKHLTCTLLMQGTSSQRTVVDIGATATKHASIVQHVLAAHALSGCDTVACLYGNGKARAIKVLQKGCTLLNLGNPNAHISDVITEATLFVAATYGSRVAGNMSDIRFGIWSAKTARKHIHKTPELRSLPPTSEAFGENVKRAHLQTAIWKSALEPDPPNLATTDYGWAKDKYSKSLTAVTLPSDASLAPATVMQMIKCGCSSEQPCATARCGCYTAQLACTVFCNCNIMGNCHNRWTKYVAELSDNESITDTVEDDVGDE